LETKLFKEKVTLLVVAAALLGGISAAHAVPVLQVGAPGGAGEGTYANYTGTLTDPPEKDTAVTSGNTIYVAGLYQSDSVVKLGSKYVGTSPTPSGQDWTDLMAGIPTIFDGKGAILVAMVADGSGASAASSLTINGALAFYSSDDENWLPNPPGDHDPAKDAISDFLYFDLDDFDELVCVPNFADETGCPGGKLGEILTLTLSGQGSLDWIHFDAMALETSVDIRGGNGPNSQIVTTTDDVGNPGSHDLTWKNDRNPPDTIPEPGTVALLGMFGAAMALIGRRRGRGTR
jgi:hypothetical protein